MYETVNSNSLEWRPDFDEIYMRVSILQDMTTREGRRAEARAIIEDYKLHFEKYALIELIGIEFL